MKARSRRSACFLVAMIATVGAPAAAQEIYYGLGVGADFIANNGDLDACAQADPSGAWQCQTLTGMAGGGAELFVGIRPWPYFGAHLVYDAFFHHGDDGAPYNLGTVQSLRAEGRVFLAPGSMFEPWLEAGAGLYLIGNEYDAAKTGGGFEAGLGADIYLAPYLSAGIAAIYRGIWFGTFHIPQAELGWAMDGGDVGEGFLHSVTVLVDLTIHSVY